MYPIERRKEILAILERATSASVEELAEQLIVGEATVRRDLDKLAKDGLITRTHGGAVRAQSENIEMPYAFRQGERATAKELIAKEAAGLLKDGQTAFMDSSSTVARIIPHIALRRGVKVITNGVITAAELSRVGVAGICTGGNIMGSSATLTGATTCDAIRRFNADIFFFSCRGVSVERGITEGTVEVGEVKEAMFARAKRRVLLVDSGKFGSAAFCSLAVPQVDYVITDAFDAGLRSYFESLGAKYIVV